MLLDAFSSVTSGLERRGSSPFRGELAIDHRDLIIGTLADLCSSWL